MNTTTIKTLSRVKISAPIRKLTASVFKVALLSIYVYLGLDSTMMRDSLQQPLSALGYRSHIPTRGSSNILPVIAHERSSRASISLDGNNAVVNTHPNDTPPAK